MRFDSERFGATSGIKVSDFLPPFVTLEVLMQRSPPMTSGLFTSLPGLSVQPSKEDPNPLVIYHGMRGLTAARGTRQPAQTSST